MKPTEKEFRDNQREFTKYLMMNNCAIVKPDSNFEIMRFFVNGKYEYVIGKKQNVEFSMVALEMWIGFISNKPVKFKKRRETRSPGEREIIFELLSERDGNKCVYCGHEHTVETFSIEHFIPTSNGGPDIISNMMITCSSCNAEVGNGSPVEKIRKIGLNGIRELAKL